MKKPPFRARETGAMRLYKYPISRVESGRASPGSTYHRIGTPRSEISSDTWTDANRSNAITLSHDDGIAIASLCDGEAAFTDEVLVH